MGRVLNEIIYIGERIPCITQETNLYTMKVPGIVQQRRLQQQISQCTDRLSEMHNSQSMTGRKDRRKGKEFIRTKVGRKGGRN